MGNEYRPASEDALAALDAVVSTPAARRKKNFFEKHMIPLKGDSKQARRRKAFFDSLLLVMLVCALVVVWTLVIDPWQANRLLEELKAQHEATETVTEGPPPETEPGQTAPPTTSKIVVETVRASHEQLKARNSDYIGWLKAPGGSVDMAVVKTANNDYYLKRDFDRKPSKYGNPYADYRVSLDPLSTNIIIYGHHMKNGTIFTYLTRYKQASVVKSSPIITMEMATGETYRYKIVSVLAINGKAEDDNGYMFAVNTPDFSGPESFEGYVRQIKERSYVDTGVDVEWGDKLISLQTCIYDFDYEFLYVIARMVRPGESLSLASVTANPSPRMPQTWYDKQKKDNPYRDAERWMP
ncbi:MAG: class B sortase [Oscillospiraceae bacterium]|nr:class B sortase [Oscillospiraceae bacterium]